MRLRSIVECGIYTRGSMEETFEFTTPSQFVLFMVDFYHFPNRELPCCPAARAREPAKRRALTRRHAREASDEKMRKMPQTLPHKRRLSVLPCTQCASVPSKDRKWRMAPKYMPPDQVKMKIKSLGQ
jgi:hypothetical protein